MSATDAAVPDSSVTDTDASVVIDAGGDDTGEESDAGWFFGTDCPPPRASSLLKQSPRILILGPGALLIADNLQAMLDADPAFTAPSVMGQEIETEVPDSGWPRGRTLMNFFYHPVRRAERLVHLEKPLSHLVMLESDVSTVTQLPEVFFEGVRVLGCRARAVGAEPIVMMPWADGDNDRWYGARLSELTYRVANGTRAAVAPVGSVWRAARSQMTLDAGVHAPYLAAATLYSGLTGRVTNYHSGALEPAMAARLASTAQVTTVAEAATVHYERVIHADIGVQIRRLAPDAGFWFMASGSSSEQMWIDRLNEIAPRAGLTPHGTIIPATNHKKLFDQASLEQALPLFQAQQFHLLFARSYSAFEDVDAVQIARAGAQTDLQVQRWERYYDTDDVEGIAALAQVEWRWIDGLGWQRRRAVMIPFHLMFAKLKTLRPSMQLLVDGVHATYPVSYGLATMSFVARTGLHPSIEGLDPDTKLAAQLGEETIRQLSALSVTGEPIADRLLDHSDGGHDAGSATCELSRKPGLAGTTWVTLCGGTFEMGSNDNVNEQPIHSVMVPTFEMLKTEVTVTQYAACVATGACTEPMTTGVCGSTVAGNWRVVGREMHPVNCLRQGQAEVVCKWLGGRLPSEAEWEFAARSRGQNVKYPWGDAEADCEHAVMLGCGNQTMAVCSKPAGNTSQGLCDLSGNVSEPVADFIHSDYVGAPDDGAAWDWPSGVSASRGGSRAGPAEEQRAAGRYGMRIHLSGVRCAK